MGIGIKIPLHKAIVFDLSTTSADGFLEQHPACILFVLYCQAGTNKNLRKLSVVTKIIKTAVATNYTFIR